MPMYDTAMTSTMMMSTTTTTTSTTTSGSSFLPNSLHSTASTMSSRSSATTTKSSLKSSDNCNHSINNNKKQKRRGVRRNVSFCEQGPAIQRIESVHNLLAANDLDHPVDKTSNNTLTSILWYDDKEIESQKLESSQLVCNHEEQSQSPTATKTTQEQDALDSIRGLERQTEQGSWQAFQNRAKALEAVLDTTCDDADELASLASTATEDARLVAQQRARQDEQDAQEYLQDIRHSLLDGSFHSSIMGMRIHPSSLIIGMTTTANHHNNEDDTDDDDDCVTFASDEESQSDESMTLESLADDDDEESLTHQRPTNNKTIAIKRMSGSSTKSGNDPLLDSSSGSSIRERIQQMNENPQPPPFAAAKRRSSRTTITNTTTTTNNPTQKKNMPRLPQRSKSLGDSASNLSAPFVHTRAHKIRQPRDSENANNNNNNTNDDDNSSRRNNTGSENDNEPQEPDWIALGKSDSGLGFMGVLDPHMAHSHDDKAERASSIKARIQKMNDQSPQQQQVPSLFAATGISKRKKKRNSSGTIGNTITAAATGLSSRQPPRSQSFHVPRSSRPAPTTSLLSSKDDDDEDTSRHDDDEELDFSSSMILSNNSSSKDWSSSNGTLLVVDVQNSNANTCTHRRERRVSNVPQSPTITTKATTCTTTTPTKDPTQLKRTKSLDRTENNTRPSLLSLSSSSSSKPQSTLAKKDETTITTTAKTTVTKQSSADYQWKDHSSTQDKVVTAATANEDDDDDDDHDSKSTSDISWAESLKKKEEAKLRAKKAKLQAYHASFANHDDDPDRDWGGTTAIHKKPLLVDNINVDPASLPKKKRKSKVTKSKSFDQDDIHVVPKQRSSTGSIAVKSMPRRTKSLSKQEALASVAMDKDDDDDDSNNANSSTLKRTKSLSKKQTAELVVGEATTSEVKKRATPRRSKSLDKESATLMKPGRSTRRPVAKKDQQPALAGGLAKFVMTAKQQQAKQALVDGDDDAESKGSRVIVVKKKAIKNKRIDSSDSETDAENAKERPRRHSTMSVGLEDLVVEDDSNGDTTKKPQQRASTGSATSTRKKGPGIRRSFTGPLPKKKPMLPSNDTASSGSSDDMKLPERSCSMGGTRKTKFPSNGKRGSTIQRIPRRSRVALTSEE